LAFIQCYLLLFTFIDFYTLLFTFIDFYTLKENRIEEKTRKLTEMKGFLNLETLSTMAGYNDWAFKMRNFMEDKHIDFPKFLKLIEENVDDETDADEVKILMKQWQVKDMDWLDEQLYQVLAQKTGGSHSDTVQNLQEFVGTRGIMAWQRVRLYARGQNQARTHDLSAGVVYPGRVKNVVELHAAFEDWMKKLIEVEKITKTTTPDERQRRRNWNVSVRCASMRSSIVKKLLVDGNPPSSELGGW